MKMFVGNGTKQRHDFVYWVPNAKSARTQRIEVGGQIQISGDLDRAAVDMIVQHHAPYGFAAASEIDHLTEQVGLCYSIDKPIGMAVLQKLMTHNASVLIKRGKDIRREASIAGNDQLENSLQESGRPESLRAMEASVVEENHDERDELPALAEGFRVIKGDGPQTAPPRRSRRRAA